MYINFNGSHSGGSSFVNVNNCWLLQNLFVYHRYKFSSERKKNKKKIRSPSIWFRTPETGSDSPIGSERDQGRDSFSLCLLTLNTLISLEVSRFTDPLG